VGGGGEAEATESSGDGGELQGGVHFRGAVSHGADTCSSPSLITDTPSSTTQRSSNLSLHGIVINAQIVHGDNQISLCKQTHLIRINYFTPYILASSSVSFTSHK
jgi:hypothetical protein